MSLATEGRDLARTDLPRMDAAQPSVYDDAQVCAASCGVIDQCGRSPYASISECTGICMSSLTKAAASFLSRPRALVWVSRFVFLTMFLNGAVVFAHGPIVPVGVLAIVLVLWAWLREGVARRATP
jgi:hypothetical protein